MLMKLLKYDLESVLKFLMIFYGLAMFFGILTRLFFSIEDSFIMNIVAQVCSGATISMIACILINNLMRLWIRFKSNLYGDESYLTHTLPVSKREIYLSKIITAIISSFVSVLVIGLTLFIVYYSKENIAFVKDLLLPLADTYNSSIVVMLLAFLFIFFLEIVNMLQVGYMGIIIGHRFNSSKMGYSVLFGFLAYIGLQLFVVGCTFIVALFNKDMMNLFITNEMISVDVVKMFIYLAMGIYMIALAIEYLINIKLFKKGVNVD